MPTFHELSSQPTCPIIYSQRRDGAILTAIKIPIDDVRLERWGWVLSLSRQDRNSKQEDVITLQDNNGQRYPKIYTVSEVANLNEQWGCNDWEVGYNDQATKIRTTRITSPLNISDIQIEMLQESLEDIRTFQGIQTRQQSDEAEQQKQNVSGIVRDQLLPILSNILDWQQQLKTYFMEMRTKLDIADDRVKEVIVQTVDTEEQIKKNDDNQQALLNSSVENLLRQIPAIISQDLEPKLDSVVNNTNTQLDIIDNELKNQMHQIQIKTESTIEACLTPYIEESKSKLGEFNKVIQERTEQSYDNLIKEIKAEYKTIESNNQEQFDEIKKEIKANIVQQEQQIHYLQDQIKKVLEITDLEAEDTGKTDNEDLAATATRIARQPTTRIGRIATTQLTMGNRYYDNVNQQSKRSFEIARILSITGGLIFIVTIAAVIFIDAFHLTQNSTVLPLGVIISAITELLAGLNFLYDRATKQFMRFHLFLDRIIRSSIAHAMIEEIKDDEQRQKAIEKIVEKLLENDPRIKE